MVVSKKIMITTETVQMEAELKDSKTAALIWKALPINAAAGSWNDEIYFAIPVRTDPANAVNVIREGDLAYRPEGRCYCMGFGKTPASTDPEIKPAHPVNLVRRFSGYPELWKKVTAGNTNKLEALQEEM